jgi:oxidoreductase
VIYPPTGKTALILGATGATGKHLLRQLLASPEYTRVGEFGRRVTAAQDLPADHSKLEQHPLDFEKLSTTDDQGLKAGKWDVVFVTYVKLYLNN